MDKPGSGEKTDQSESFEKEPCPRDDCEVRRIATALQKEIAQRRHIEERLADAQRIAHVGHWDWDIVTNDLSWSDEVYRIFGLEPQEFGATYEAFLNRVHSEDREAVRQAVNCAVFDQAAYSIDHRIVRPDGQVRTVHEQAEVTFDDKRKACRMLGTIHDVTETRMISAELERKEELLRLVLEALPVGVWIADQTGWITTTNQAAVQIWGAAPHVGLSDYPVYKTSDLKSGRELQPEDRAIARALRTRKHLTSQESRIETFDGKAKVVRTWGAPILSATGQLNGAIAVVEDITTQFEAKQALSRAGEELRKLTQHQIRIRELEKGAIARELHEGIGQLLSGALMQIASVHNEVGANRELADKCAGLEAVVREAIEVIRRLSCELRPPLLDHFGLKDALDWLVTETKQTHGIACDFSAYGKMPGGDDVRSLELFRICQEAFSNAIRQGAIRITVDVRTQGSAICLDVRDYGARTSGSDADDALAIVGMRERAAGMCGTLEMRIDPEHGRIITVSIPDPALSPAAQDRGV